MSSRSLVVVSLLALLAGAVTGERWFTLPQASSEPPEGTALELPAAWDPGTTKAAHARLAQHYRTEGKVAEKGTEAPVWRLRGIVLQGEGNLALIEQEGKISRRGVGDPLPGGERLTAIDAGGIHYQNAGDERVTRLYEMASTMPAKNGK